MSLSKTSQKQAVSRNSNTIPRATAFSADAGVALSAPYNPKTIIHKNAFDDSKLIVLTINPDLDKVSATPNAKAESAKQLFASYRDQK